MIGDHVLRTVAPEPGGPDDRDAVPDLDTLSAGIRGGIDELLKEAAQTA